MTPNFALFFAGLLLPAAMLLLWQLKRSKPVDWELYVAFIRREFPPQQREIAQALAAQLARFVVGFQIKNLRPEHSLKEIAEWSHDSFSALELAIACAEEFGVVSDGDTTFQALVGRVVAKRRRGA
jgi:hypothetical protein